MLRVLYRHGNRFSVWGGSGAPWIQKSITRPHIAPPVSAYEVIEDCRAEGTRKVELRFSPSFVTEYSGMSWDEALDAFERGLTRALSAYPEMKAGFIAIASRDYGVDATEATVDFYLKHQKRFAGLDLAGNEDKFPCRLFEKPFKKAIESKARITIHAGEASGPENIWEAIELLGAQRIGHGIASVQDPELMKFLAQNQICLEMCPTSNWLTQATPDLSQHPLPRVLRAGVPVCINTDDPGIFGVTLPYEMNVCRVQMGMTDAEIARCMEHASRASFLQ